ncbi:MAG: hypothetical protein RL701_350 [Pseudomonadota bacterium]|jgi:uncharacterized protein (DUF58 family)
MTALTTDSDEHAVLRACQAFRWERAALHARGEVGTERALGAGASADFYGFRAYAPGDDLRRVDWSVYARTRELTLRLYRQETHPQLDILLDTSRSMALRDGRKPELTRELAAFAWHSARLQGSSARIFACGEGMQWLPDVNAHFTYAPTCCLFEAPARCVQKLRPGAVRLLISDCMSEHAPERALRELAAAASRVVVLLTWGPWEAQPSLAGATELIDSETNAAVLSTLSAATLERYQQRLARLSEGVMSACRGVGAQCVNVVCDAALADVLRRDLLPAWLVRPA